ncbi:DUF3800 domain-containing protein [Halorhodospira halochloris]|uniref:DUF3800 domain-containing protein n=1 Tax=Halorhodospira halochloris TaxID=1052 RepID=UPI001EE890FD|nr:DUF3800 domain-containing protein [Halorhodospira halochloris]MCG5531277.1 DUF3800 domain-containing protein [Halorhodospira halochloris]
MYLIYFDEVKPEADHPHYHIGAVAIEESNLASVEAEISAIAKRCFGSTVLSESTELHAADIYHRNKNFKTWEDFEDRLQIILEFLPILSRSEVNLINIQINCQKLNASKEEKDIAFMYFCERANDLVRGNSELGILIGDRENDRISADYAETLSGYRDRGTGFMFGREIQSLVDSVHFTHSHLSRFIQLADVYAWLCQFRLRNQGSGNHRHKALLDALKQDDVDLFPVKYKIWP